MDKSDQTCFEQIIVIQRVFDNSFEKDQKIKRVTLSEQCNNKITQPLLMANSKANL